MGEQIFITAYLYAVIIIEKIVPSPLFSS